MIKKYLHTTELFRPAKPEALKSSQTKNKKSMSCYAFGISASSILHTSSI